VRYVFVLLVKYKANIMADSEVAFCGHPIFLNTHFRCINKPHALYTTFSRTLSTFTC